MSLAQPAPLTAPLTTRFDLFGQIQPLAKADNGAAWKPTRPFGGWLATYGRIGPNGGIIPTEDRQGHIFDAARTIGLIDFSDYLTKGVWNDTHIGFTEETKDQKPIVVGRPTLLEFHDESSPLAKAHQKVGFWTEGHLFDRADPRSWTLFGDYTPTEKDLERSDYFWTVAAMLKGLPRSLGFSAQGRMLLSPCGKRIIWAKIDQNAVCETPVNPYATSMPLQLAVRDGRSWSHDIRVTPDMVGKSPCDSCLCPPGARCPTLAKGGQPADTDAKVSATELAVEKPDEHDSEEQLVQALVKQYRCSEKAARRWVKKYLAKPQSSPAPTPTTESAHG